MPQIRIKPITKEEQLKLKVNPFTPLAYNKYTHQLIDSHMFNHARRISEAKSRVDTSIPKSAVRCIRSRDRFKVGARKELFIATPLEMETELDDKMFSENYFQDSQDLFELYEQDGYHGNGSLNKTRITKTGKQTISRRTTTTTTTIPWRHTSKTECLGQKTNFPSLVTSVCATQLATKRMQKNVKYKHVKSKIRQMYFETEEKDRRKDTQINISQSGSDYSSDPDHEVELSDDKLELSENKLELPCDNSEMKEDDLAPQTKFSLNETFNLTDTPLDEYNQPGTGTINITPEVETPNPTEELEYLRLKREITQECVKYNIFTPAGVKKLCRKITDNKSDIKEDRVSDLIGQIISELSD